MSENVDAVKQALVKEGFEEVSGATQGTWDFDTNPIFRGTFIETEEGIGANNSKMHFFNDDKGETVGVWGTAILDARLRTCKPGDTVVIIFEGRKKSEKVKGREYKDFTVHKKSATGTAPAKNPGEDIPF